MILAASDEGVTLYLYHDDSKLKYGNLVYREKQGDITVLAVPSLTDYYVDGNEIVTDLQIPVIVFDSFPEAVRAEMEIELSVKYIEETVFQKKYTSSADREAEGYFLFDLIAYNFRPQRYEYEAFYNLASFSDDISGRTYYTGNPIPVTVRFYDQNGALICTQSVEICSPVAEAHAKRGE